MKIDWKHLATTTGYKSIKAAYIKDITWKWGTKKDVAIDYFNKIIGKAKSHAHHTGRSIEQVLNEWEEKRDSALSSFYSDFHMPKARAKDSLNRQGIKGGRKYNAKWNRDPEIRKHANCTMINRINKAASKKSKPRWDTSYKKREAERREWLKTCL